MLSLKSINGYGKIWNLSSVYKYHYSGMINDATMPNGYGEIIYYNHPTIIKYTGYFIDGLKHGSGTETYTNNDIFCGEK